MLIKKIIFSFILIQACSHYHPAAESFESAFGDPNVVVSTLAGSGLKGLKDGIGSNATFTLLSGVALDSLGNLYVADVHSIRKIVIATGEVSTLILIDETGSDVSVYSSEGIATDSLGNLYVAGGYVIKKIVIATLKVTTLAGSGSKGFKDGIGSNATFSYLSGVALDSLGNLYVADVGNHSIRKLVLSTGEVSTLAGSGSKGFKNGAANQAYFDHPTGIVADSLGNLYIADAHNNSIRKIVTSTREVSTLAGLGPNSKFNAFENAASFAFPVGVAIDSLGNLYVASAHRIRKIVLSTGQVSTLAGSRSEEFVNGKGNQASFRWPRGIAIDSSGTLYVADSDNNRIRMIKPSAHNPK